MILEIPNLCDSQVWNRWFSNGVIHVCVVVKLERWCKGSKLIISDKKKHF